MAEEYFHQDYPRILFHPDGRTVEVRTKEEEDAKLGEGFVKSPSEYGVETAAAAPAPVATGYVMPGYVAPSHQPSPPRGGSTGSTEADTAAQAEVAKLEEEATSYSSRRRS